MPTTDERLTSLEVVVADIQTEVLSRARTAEMSALETVRDAQFTINGTEHDDYEIRLAKIERALAVILKAQMTIFKKDLNDQLPEDIDFSTSSIGPVLKSADGNQWRLTVGNDGAVSSAEV